ncbi:hypothetical protein [Methylibium sp. T29]|uniref:hypothetical protein n=1 Tax=Methylibium sp. T29 TaxID=1430884 RepID=UPI00137795B1|nr:hypothetical protein [Methylibium sp. T29]
MWRALQSRGVAATGIRYLIGYGKEAPARMTIMDSTVDKPGPVALAVWATAQRLVGKVQGASRAARRQISACFTRTAGALCFDLAVFMALALMAATLLTPLDQPLGDGAGWMLSCLGVFAAFWCSIAAADLERLRKLRRRFLARAPQAPRAAPRVQALPPDAVLMPTTMATMLPPLRVRSAYRPSRVIRPLPSRSLLRTASRSH